MGKMIYTNFLHGWVVSKQEKNIKLKIIYKYQELV